MSADEPNLRATMMASSVAGSLARIPCHPLDTIKARLQAFPPGPLSSGVSGTLAGILRTEGVLGLYRGFGVAFVAGVPAGCLYFSTYETAKHALAGVPGAESAVFATHFLAGLIAEGVSCVLWVPIDVVKERMQVQGRPAPGTAPPAGYYTSTLHAVRTITATEGARGVYRGYAATLVSFGPYSGLYFMFYEQAKRIFHWSNGTSRLEEIPMAFSLAAGAGAGALAAALTNPLDLVKLRLQVHRSAQSRHPVGLGSAEGANRATFAYSGVLDGLRTVLRCDPSCDGVSLRSVPITLSAPDRREGPRALFRGAGARVLFCAPATALSIALYEQIKVAIIKE